MEWVASTLHTTPEHGVSSITTADTHTSAASSKLNRSPRRFKWTRPFRRKTISGFCAYAITFQLASTNLHGNTFQNRYQINYQKKKAQWIDVTISPRINEILQSQRLPVLNHMNGILSYSTQDWYIKPNTFAVSDRMKIVPVLSPIVTR